CTSIVIGHTLAHHEGPRWGERLRHQPRPWRHTITAAQLATPNTTARSTTRISRPMGSGSSRVAAAGRATPLVAGGAVADVAVVGGTVVVVGDAEVVVTGLAVAVGRRAVVVVTFF